MTQKKDDKNQDIEEILEEGLVDIEEAEKNHEKELENTSNIEQEVLVLKESLARSQADYHNLVRRVDRDRSEMWEFLTANIVSKFLPTIDNLERVISSTPEDMQWNSLFEWVKSIHSALIKNLDSMWIKTFESVGQTVDANLHDVMSQMPWEEWIIIQEFEKWYKLADKVIRHAKVIVGSGN